MRSGRRAASVRERLDAIFRVYHHPRFIHPDPLEFVRRYPVLPDREVAALVASGLAYGQMKGILSSIQRILGPLGPRPARFIRDHTDRQLDQRWSGFRHRWTRAGEVICLVRTAVELQREQGSLGSGLARLVKPGDQDLHPALQAWVAEWRERGLPARHSLLADPGRGSACKRLYLMARWLARRDEVDPGGWEAIPPALLLVPVDVHLHRMARVLGFTRRKAADLATVREITRGFRRLEPADPARYDFALTRLALHARLPWPAIRGLLRGDQYAAT